MDVIQPLDHHTVTVLLLQLGLLLLVARLLGYAATRAGLPSVLGELLAGIVLGPSILGTIAPGAFTALIPTDPARFHLIEVFAFFGVLLLLVITGLETDIDLIARKGRSAAAVSLCGIAVPFAIGFVLGQLLPEAFIADTSQRLVFSLFLGTAMGISAIPVIAKVLIEMKAVRRDIGQLTLAAGMIDDTIGWILLSVVAGLARSGVVDLPSVIQSVLSVLVVVGLAFTAGRRLMNWLFRVVDERDAGDLAKVTLLMVLALLAGSLTHYLGIEAVLGAFLVGILVGQVKRFHRSARHIFETFTLGVFAPIFFAASGLRVDLRALLDPTVLGVGLLVLAVAIVGKFAGAALGAKMSGLGKWEALSLGAGMNARGAIEIIVATIGLGLGVLTPEMYTIILLVAIVTSLMAPPILRVTLRRVPWSDEERKRFEAAERRESSFIASLNRVLMPTRGGKNSFLAARLLALAIGAERDVAVTTMAVVGSRGSAGAQPLDAVPIAAVAVDGRDQALLVETNGAVPIAAVAVDGREVARARQSAAAAVEAEAVEADRAIDALQRNLGGLDRSNLRRLVQHAQGSVVDTVIAELDRGYDLLVLGATTNGHRTDDHPLFGTLTDRLVQSARCPVFVVSDRGNLTDDAVQDLSFDRILLPTAGTGGGTHSIEVACAIARATDATIEILHIVEQDPGVEPWSSPQARNASEEIGRELLATTAEYVSSAGVSSRTHLVTRTRVEAGIVEFAEQLEAGLVVLSSSVRPVTRRAFFGHRIDHVLGAAQCPVLVIS